MGKRRILDYIPGGIEWFEFDEETGQGRITAEYDITACFDANKIAQNDGTNGWSKSRNMKREASIPLAVAEKWLIEEGIDVYNKDHWPAVRRKLNSSDYAYLRTSTGRI